MFARTVLPLLGGAPAVWNTAMMFFQVVLPAFVPSSLMLGVTTFITSDIATVPLFWVIPLALYLLSFVLVFARKLRLPQPLLAQVRPMFLVGLVMLLGMRATQPLGLVMIFHLATFFSGRVDVSWRTGPGPAFAASPD
jgi:hypothetical protein